MVHQHTTAITFINRSTWNRAIYMKSLSVIMIRTVYSHGISMCCAAIWSSPYSVQRNNCQAFQVSWKTKPISNTFNKWRDKYATKDKKRKTHSHLDKMTRMTHFPNKSIYYYWFSCGGDCPCIDQQLTSLLDSDGFELDKNYYRVEPTLDCHQKESVQVRARCIFYFHK